METIKESIFLLTLTPYRDSDFVVNFLSPQYGKLSAVVYKGRRIGKASSFLYQPGDLLDVEYRVRENDEFIKISNISGRNTLDTARFSYNRFLFHSYLLELISRISQPGNPSEDLFELLLTNMTWKWKSSSNLFEIGWFIWMLASHGGFGIDYHSCSVCGKTTWRYNDNQEAVFRKENYRFQLNSGALLCNSCVQIEDPSDAITPAMLKVMWLMESYRLTEQEKPSVPDEVLTGVIQRLNSHLLQRYDIRPKSLELFLSSLNLS